jgi:hypothetical protein
MPRVASKPRNGSGRYPKSTQELQRSNGTVFDAGVASGARQDAPAAFASLAALRSFSELECPAGADFRREVGIDFLGKGNAGHA